jgi:hypothetical protein
MACKVSSSMTDSMQGNHLNSCIHSLKLQTFSCSSIVVKLATMACKPVLLQLLCKKAVSLLKLHPRLVEILVLREDFMAVKTCYCNGKFCDKLNLVIVTTTSL